MAIAGRLWCVWRHLRHTRLPQYSPRTIHECFLLDLGLGYLLMYILPCWVPSSREVPKSHASADHIMLRINAERNASVEIRQIVEGKQQGSS